MRGIRVIYVIYVCRFKKVETMSGEKKKEKKKRRGAASFHLIRFRVKGRSENEGREREREGGRSGDESDYRMAGQLVSAWRLASLSLFYLRLFLLINAIDSKKLNTFHSRVDNIWPLDREIYEIASSFYSKLSNPFCRDLSCVYTRWK